MVCLFIAVMGIVTGGDIWLVSVPQVNIGTLDSRYNAVGYNTIQYSGVKQAANHYPNQ